MSIGIPPDDKDGINIEFCSGYTDEKGKWNSGFYCPNDGDSQAFFCCGTPNYKYCCTYKDLVEEESFKSWYIIMGVVVCVSLLIILTTAVCRICCPSNKKETDNRRPSSKQISIYQMQIASSGADDANMYSYPIPESQLRATTERHESETIGTSRAVSQLLLEIESDAIITNTGDSCTDSTLPLKDDTTAKSALRHHSPIPEIRSISNGIPELPEDTELYWSTKF